MYVLVACAFVFGCKPRTAQIRAPYIDPSCPRIRTINGSIRGDIIHDRDQAKIIGNAIINGLHTKKSKYTAGVYADDLGKKWKILEKLKSGVYGGDIEFMLDKCQGTITNLKIEPE